MDSRKVLDVEPVSIDQVCVGDFIAAPSWSRPRLVVSIDGNAEGRTLALEEPDADRQNEHGLRVVSAPEWNRRARLVSDAGYDSEGAPLGERYVWKRWPNLTKLWAGQGG